MGAASIPSDPNRAGKDAVLFIQVVETAKNPCGGKEARAQKRRDCGREPFPDRIREKCQIQI